MHELYQAYVEYPTQAGIFFSPFLEQRKYWHRFVDNKINFEIGALFHSPIRWAKKRADSKINLVVDQTRSFLFCFCSSFVYFLGVKYILHLKCKAYDWEKRLTFFKEKSWAFYTIFRERLLSLFTVAPSCSFMHCVNILMIYFSGFLDSSERFENLDNWGDFVYARPTIHADSRRRFDGLDSQID